MSNAETDYSNTIFYKISCKNENISDVYIGHTTNFVQRKKCHKYSCLSMMTPNSNCKVYNVIRANGGWDNWIMAIIDFQNCNDLSAARRREQELFISNNATLNSIEPMPTPKPKPIAKPITKPIAKPKPKPIAKPKKTILDLDAFNKSNFKCDICEYATNNKFDFSKHLLTPKHVKRNELSDLGQTISINRNELYACRTCNKPYKSRNGLWYHEKKCKPTPEPTTQGQQVDISVVLELLKQNQDFKELIIEQQQKSDHIQQQLLEAVKEGKLYK